MVRGEFWRDWKHKTKIEEQAIKSIKKAKNVLFSNIPRDKIYAIYIKGSFVRREMNEKSDVDIVPVATDNIALEKIRKLQRTKGDLYKPSELLPHSLQEFKQGKRYKKDKLKGNVDGALRNLNRYKLIYGKPIDTQQYRMRSDLEFLQDFIKAFKTTFIPMYKTKKFGFAGLMKQVFWLVEREERVKGNDAPSSWKELARSIKNKDHMIHDAIRYRMHPTKDTKARRQLLAKIQRYVKTLSKTYL